VIELAVGERGGDNVAGIVGGTDGTVTFNNISAYSDVLN